MVDSAKDCSDVSSFSGANEKAQQEPQRKVAPYYGFGITAADAMRSTGILGGECGFQTSTAAAPPAQSQFWTNRGDFATAKRCGYAESTALHEWSIPLSQKKRPSRGKPRAGKEKSVRDSTCL